LAKHIHIVALNIPYPPDYGGIIDAFYRIEALHALDIKIHLHCFEYGRKHSEELARLCHSVTYYKRKKGLFYYARLTPYVVATRVSDELLKNLSQDDYPILFEGLHTTIYLNHPKLKGRTTIVRAHNIEHQYYQTLAKLEHNPLKKLFFLTEAFKLKRFEKVLHHATHVMSVSLSEHEYFQHQYGNSVFIPSSHPYKKVESLPGKGHFILYHGDLSVNENQQISKFLIESVFSKTEYSCVIAGKNPPSWLQELAQTSPNVQMVASPDKDAMQSLLREAHIHLLPVMQNNGLKLKLLLALYAGRHCLVNRNMIGGTSLAPLCQVAETAEEMVSEINRLMALPFTEEMAEMRTQFLYANYSNETNARKLIDLL
jgi:hypothetical protein